MENPSVLIIGGGHNGLTAAAYLAKSGIDVTVLERLPNFGGAAVSAQAFEGIDAKLSRYSYLVSLLPKQIVEDLGLNISLAQRRYSSYTPIPGSDEGLLVDNQDQEATSASFERLSAGQDFRSWQRFYGETQELAGKLWPSVLKPLQRRRELKQQVGNQAIWDKFMEQPVGQAVSREFSNDWVQGVVYTDALIGTFSPNQDQTLNANRCFLYHVIGGGTGAWNVPIGGMGAVTRELERAAERNGAKLISSAEAIGVSSHKNGVTVRYRSSGQEHELSASLLLVNASRQELASLKGESLEHHPKKPSQDSPYVHGAQVKVNLLLRRLPKLKDQSVSPEAAFGGTFHINESFEQLQSAYDAASKGEIPDPLPCEIYCHSLTDPSILGPDLRALGAQTLTVFALHAPHSLVANLTAAEHDAMRAKLEAAVISSLNSVLAEPIEDLLILDSNEKPCIETKTTRDLEEALKLPGGNIFHEPLSWPFAEDDEPLDSPAARWGVATDDPKVLICGASARRGGAVSGIGGHNAAMAALEIFG